MIRRTARNQRSGSRLLLGVLILALVAVGVMILAGSLDRVDPEAKDPVPVLPAIDQPENEAVAAEPEIIPDLPEVVDSPPAESNNLTDPDETDIVDTDPPDPEVKPDTAPEEPLPVISQPEEEPAEPDNYQTFTGDQFNQLFNQVELPNLALLGDPPVIVDDNEADGRIRQIALDRGYRHRPEPADIAQLVLVEGDRHRLQPEAAQAYEDLRAAAAAEGLTIWLVSAYRSYDYQRTLFLRQVEAPYPDEVIFNRLKLVALPGYSKHHTGYTIDIAEGNLVFGDFAKSASYTWLSVNNYENAKRHGWIPSYPPDAIDQGPDPEPWEFTYVGPQHLIR